MTTATEQRRYTDFASRKETFQAALTSLFSGKPEDTEADLTKLFTPSFTMRADGETFDFPGFVAHIRHLREILPAGSVELRTVQFLRDGSQLAERHASTTKFPDGTKGKAETFFFAEVAEDGRLEWIVESVSSAIEKGGVGETA